MAIRPNIQVLIKEIKPEIPKEEEVQDEALDLEEVSETNSTQTKTNDMIVISGKSAGIYGELTDAEILAAFDGEDSSSATSRIYNGTLDAFLSDIKRVIYNMHHKAAPEKPSPENPTPENPTPENPSPDDVSDDGEEPEAPATIDYTLTRKSANAQSIMVPTEGITLKLANSVDGKEYTYTISSLSGSAVFATFEYLDNGRLVITGDYLDIAATGGQDDDIVLLGENCNINTNSGNDIVRVGGAVDSEVVSGKYVQKNYNTINTGSGDDYIINFGVRSTVVGGSGNDNTLMIGMSASDMEKFDITGKGIENIIGRKDKTNGTSNNKLDGGGYQGGYGDCKFLSFLNSLQGNFSDYVKITPSSSGDKYTVQFLKSGSSMQVSKSELLTSSGTIGNAQGDIDFVLTEIAFRKLIENKGYNMYDGELTDTKSLGSSVNNFLISEIMLGAKSSAGCYELNDWLLTLLLEAYNNGEISNLVLGTQDKDSGEPDNNQLGIYYNHAYGIKGGVVGKYIIVSNPWDGNDRIKLDWDDALTYFGSVNLFGDSYDIIRPYLSSSANNEQEIILKNYTYCGLESQSTPDVNNIFAEDTDLQKKVIFDLISKR